MKRVKLIKTLKEHGCVFLREGSRHTVFLNPKTTKISTIPRHNEIDDFLAKKIIKDLGLEVGRKR